MKPALALLLLALAAALAFSTSPAYAQIELTETDPADGATLDAAPEVVHLCFSQPVNIEDETSFSFTYLMPDSRALGLRIVFQPDGECVDVHAGLPEERPAGEYTFEWQVAAAEGGEEGSGTLQFEVSENITVTPAPTPTPSDTPPVTPSPEGGTENGDADDDDGPDILLVALITIGSVGGAAVLFTLGYFLRRRIGYEPHRPTEGDEGGSDH